MKCERRHRSVAFPCLDNTRCNALRSGIPEDERRWLALDADFVLGLDLDRVWATSMTEHDGVSPRQRELLDERTKARSSRDFERADELRHELLEEGVEETDLPGGQSTWRKLERR